MERSCEENERGAHSEKNVRCGHTGEKKKRTTKPTMERCMQERHDKSGSERRQHDKQGRMEEYDHQLYRRPQMTGHAREEEEVLILVLCDRITKVKIKGKEYRTVVRPALM